VRGPKSISCFPFRQGRRLAQASARRLVPSAARLHENHGAMSRESASPASRRPRRPSSGEARRQRRTIDRSRGSPGENGGNGKRSRVPRGWRVTALSIVAFACCAHARQREPGGGKGAPKGGAEQERRRRGSLAFPPSGVDGLRRTGPASIPALYLCPSARIGTFNQRASAAPAAAAARGGSTGRKRSNCG
jgi:hypothetical protein